MKVHFKDSQPLHLKNGWKLASSDQRQGLKVEGSLLSTFNLELAAIYNGIFIKIHGDSPWVSYQERFQPVVSVIFCLL